MPQPNWIVQAGIAKEPSWGTATVPPTASISVDDPIFEETQDPIYDKGLRGLRSATQAIFFGAGFTTVKFANMPYYGDDTGHFVMGMLGVDTIAGTARTGTIGAVAAGATSVTYTVGTGGSSTTGDIFLIDAGLPTAEIVVPTSIAANVWTVPATGANSFKFAHGAAAPVKTLFSHTLTVTNAGQPPSYTGAKFDNLVTTARQVTGIYWEQVDFALKNPGSFLVSATGLGKLGSNIIKPVFPAYSNEPFNIPWQAQLTVGNVANARFVGFDVSLKAKNDQIFGMNGTQSASASISDQLIVDGKATVVPDDYTEFLYYVNNTQPTFSMLLDNGSTRTVLQMSKFAFLKPTTLDHKGNFSMLDVTWEAVCNATDAGTGNAPVKFVIFNSRSTAY